MSRIYATFNFKNTRTKWSCKLWSTIFSFLLIFFYWLQMILYLKKKKKRKSRILQFYTYIYVREIKSIFLVSEKKIHFCALCERSCVFDKASNYFIWIKIFDITGFFAIGKPNVYFTIWWIYFEQKWWIKRSRKLILYNLFQQLW